MVNCFQNWSEPATSTHKVGCHSTKLTPYSSIMCLEAEAVELSADQFIVPDLGL